MVRPTALSRRSLRVQVPLAVRIGSSPTWRGGRPVKAHALGSIPRLPATARWPRGQGIRLQSGSRRFDSGSGVDGPMRTTGFLHLPHKRNQNNTLSNGFTDHLIRGTVGVATGVHFPSRSERKASGRQPIAQGVRLPLLVPMWRSFNGQDPALPTLGWGFDSPSPHHAVMTERPGSCLPSRPRGFDSRSPFKIGRCAGMGSFPHHSEGVAQLARAPANKSGRSGSRPAPSTCSAGSPADCFSDRCDAPDFFLVRLQALLTAAAHEGARWHDAGAPGPRSDSAAASGEVASLVARTVRVRHLPAALKWRCEGSGYFSE